MRSFKEIATTELEIEEGCELHRAAKSNNQEILSLTENIASGCYEVTISSDELFNAVEFRTKEEADEHFEKHLVSHDDFI